MGARRAGGAPFFEEDTMSWRLRKGLSCCEVDDRLVFLDLEADRYFQLPAHLDTALLAALRGDARQDAEIDSLVAKRILIRSPNPPPSSPTTSIAPPSRSAVEQRTSAPDFDPITALEVVAITLSTLLQLKTRRLDRLIESLVAHRERMTMGSLSNASPHDMEQLLASAAMFRKARACVPVEPCCLPDSIALVRFLARRRLPAAIVFGVALDPFAAHCWVQTGDWVLNDTVGNVMAHTPIRSV
jgi:hypothetical protein